MEDGDGGWEGVVRYTGGVSSRLKVTLSIESGGEGRVVQRPWWCSMAGVRRHPHDAVLCLFGRKFSPQLLHQYVGLWKKKKTLWTCFPKHSC